MPEKFIFSGKVQGVFFRDHCLKEANRLGLDGHVKNLNDGTVELVVSGLKADELIRSCLLRYADARVILVGETDDPVIAGFEVRY